MSLRGARVLVTGATGFTARYVIPLLEAEGAEVWRLARAAAEFPNALACDILDAAAAREAVRRATPTHVIHLAGTSNLADHHAERMHELNVVGTCSLLEACRVEAPDVQKVLIASSGFVYGDTAGRVADEAYPANPAGAYGRTKLEMERACKGYLPALPLVLVRPFNYTGVGHDPRFLVPKLIRSFVAGDASADFVQGEVVRDFSDVRWVARAYVNLLQHAASGDIVNICSGRGTRLGDIVAMVSEIAGRPTSNRPMVGVRTSHLVGSAEKLSAVARIGRCPDLAETLAWMVQAAQRDTA